MTAKACATLPTSEQADPALQHLVPALEHAGVAVLVLNANMQIIVVHGAVERCISSADLSTAVPVLHVMPAAVHDAWRMAHASIVGGSASHAAIHVERNDQSGFHHVVWHLTPLPADSDDPLVLCVGRDVTEQHIAEQREQQTMALAVHELRAPVTVLKGFAQLAFKRADAGDQGSPVRRMLQRIDQQSDRLTYLLDRFMDMVRIQQGKLRLLVGPVDLVALANDVVCARQHDVGERVLQVQGEVGVTVVADLRRLQHALGLLLDNALKYSPANSPVHIGVRCTSSTAHVSVHDYGAHIPTAQQHWVWEPWYHAPADVRRQLGGMGLRLHTVKHIVERHGGEV